MTLDDPCPLVCCNPAPLAVVDLETTGLDPKENEIVEIAVVLCNADGSQTGERFVSRVKPGGPVGASWIHGITEDDVKDAPTFFEISGTVVDLLAGRVVVAHNAYFDVRFLGNELTRAARVSGLLGEDEKFPMFPTMCTMWSSEVIGLGGRVSLANACRHIGYDLVNAHSALADATATSGLAQEILSSARSQGVHVRKFGDPSTPHISYGSFPELPRGSIASVV